MPAQTILAPESLVLVGFPTCDIPAQIVCTHLYPNGGVLYRVEWWDGRTRHEETLGAESLKPVETAQWLKVSR